MKFQKWNIAATDRDVVEKLTESGYPWLVSSVLARRGVTSAEEAAAF